MLCATERSFSAGPPGELPTGSDKGENCLSLLLCRYKMIRGVMHMKIPDGFERGIDLPRSIGRYQKEPTPQAKLQLFRELKSAKYLVPYRGTGKILRRYEQRRGRFSCRHLPVNSS